MKQIFIFLFIPAFLMTAYGQAVEKQPLRTGDKLVFQSKVLDGEMNISVGLPAGYDQSNIRYPVHYVLDGQILFGFYYGVSDILTKGEMPECIIVGIRSVRRGQYYMPGEGADNFTRFLTGELIPYIDRNYRTTDFRMICGHSTSGAFVIHALLFHPGIFDMYFAGAPYHSEKFSAINIDSLFSALQEKEHLYTFFGVKDNPKQIEEWESLRFRIERSGQNRKIRITDRRYENEDHYSVVWRYIPDGLREAFIKWKYVPAPSEEFSFSAYRDYNRMQQSMYNTTFNYTEGYFIGHGISLQQKEQHDTAIQLLEDGLDHYPQSLALHNILAVSYKNSGQPYRAKEHYEIMLEIDPGLEDIRKKLEELE